jgi:hypothetical protein
MWSIWYIYTYGPPPILFFFIIRFYNFYGDFFTYCNKIIYPLYWDDEKSEEKLEPNNIEVIFEQPKEPSKYEDKYLEDIRSLNKEWIFTEQENNQTPKLIEDFCNGYIENKENKIEEITNEIFNLKKEISEVNYVEDVDDEGDELIYENTLEEKNKRRKQIQELQEKYNSLKLEITSEEGLKQIKIQSQEQANRYIINKRIEKLKNCYVIEKTPISNVLIIYEKDTESFKYYSDYIIPYRYLEVVGRKYVKLFGCRPIFVDMEEELKLFEEKWEKEQELKKIKEQEDKKRGEEAAKKQQPVEQKKNVFAKFKSYNKDAGGKISMAVPPKNSIPNKTATENKENKKILLKERANRYTYEGKFANFNFLQKIERKVFNKKLGLLYADFKKMLSLSYDDFKKM